MPLARSAQRTLAVKYERFWPYSWKGPEVTLFNFRLLLLLMVASIRSVNKRIDCLVRLAIVPVDFDGGSSMPIPQRLGLCRIVCC